MSHGFTYLARLQKMCCPSPQLSILLVDLSYGRAPILASVECSTQISLLNDMPLVFSSSKCREEVESNVLFPMSHPELYAAVAEKTRVRPEPNQFGAYVSDLAVIGLAKCFRYRCIGILAVSAQ